MLRFSKSILQKVSFDRALLKGVEKIYLLDKKRRVNDVKSLVSCQFWQI